MQEKRSMMELPISKDIKELYRKQNKEFTDSEKASDRVVLCYRKR